MGGTHLLSLFQYYTSFIFIFLKRKPSCKLPTYPTLQGLLFQPIDNHNAFYPSTFISTYTFNQNFIIGSHSIKSSSCVMFCGWIRGIAILAWLFEYKEANEEGIKLIKITREK